MISRGASITSDEAQILGLPASMVGQASAVLPYYLSTQEGQLGSKAASQALASMNLYGTPQQELSMYQGILGKYSTAQQQSDQLGRDIASGRVTQQMLAEEQPVAQARTDVALTQKNAALEQLDQTLNQIDAIQARKGYSGDSYGNRLLKFNARAGIMGQAAGNVAQANLANALGKQQVQAQGRQLQLNNLSLPGQLAQGDISLLGLPSAAMATRTGSSLGPLSFFQIGPHASQFQPPPLVGPNANLGQILGQTGSSLAGSLGNYWQNKQLIDAINKNSQPGAATLTPGDLSPGMRNPDGSFTPTPPPQSNVDQMMNGPSSSGLDTSGLGSLSSDL